MTPVEVSARHLHLTQEDVDRLFGPGYELENKRELSQKGYFVAAERVQVMGKKGTASFGILTPLRRKTQVELSVTDAIKLGIEPVVRMSGDLSGTPGCVLKGPAGQLELKEGVIVAKRHIHINDQLAKDHGLKDDDLVKVRIEGERGLTFEQVVIRTDPAFDITLHIDTDEGNALLASSGRQIFGEILY